MRPEDRIRGYNTLARVHRLDTLGIPQICRHQSLNTTDTLDTSLIYVGNAELSENAEEAIRYFLRVFRDLCDITKMLGDKLCPNL